MRSSEAGPIRIKYLNIESQAVDEELESSANYFSNALNIYSRLVPITVSCEGHQIDVSDADIAIIFKPSQGLHPHGFKSLTCANEDSEMQYPIAGIIYSNNFNKHEIFPLIVASTIRVLGLNFDQIDFWKKNQKGEPYASRPIVEGDSNGKTKQFLNSPIALALLREAFDTNDLIGIELEDHPSTQGMIFWEARHFRFEIMSLSIPYDVYVATFTLGALEDSSWYFPNYAMSNKPYLGRGEGKKYFSGPCKYGDSGVDQKFWCVNENQDTCGPMHLSIVECEDKSKYHDFGVNDGCPQTQNKHKLCRYPPYGDNSGINQRCINVFNNGRNSECVDVIFCSKTDANILYLNKVVKCPFTGGKV
jgi:hypothetical protein